MNELTQSITFFVTAADVLDHAELKHGADEVSAAITDAAERLAYAIYDDGPAEVDRAEVLDEWRGEYAPSWVIYAGETEEVIYQVGISECFGAYWDMTGSNPGEVSDLIGAVHNDLTGAVVAAFENCADWDGLIAELEGEDG
ncbi:hypothetical protein [Brevibacterium album]|uniref:hypothetical protein n=1 Tax=Brevibacterium album TaxID=417948 RepID=UPI0004251D7D|nr:hypothetical protein [Brevibacterium album]